MKRYGGYYLENIGGEEYKISEFTVSGIDTYQTLRDVVSFFETHGMKILSVSTGSVKAEKSMSIEEFIRFCEQYGFSAIVR